MAKVAKVVAPSGSLGSDQLLFCGGGGPMKARNVVKRKTPSELREEQLKRRIATELVQDSSAPLENTDVVNSGTKKPEGLKNTRYVDKRLDEVYPARKPNSRLSLLSVKSKFKENKVIEETNGMKSSFGSHLTPKNHEEVGGGKSASAANVKPLQQCKNAQKDSENKFFSVAELSLGSDRFVQSASVDMDKALKGLAARETSGSCSSPTSAGKSNSQKSTLGSFCSEIHIPGRKVPLDFTLKTAIRIVSSSPVDRFHRLLMGGSYNGVNQIPFQFGLSGNRSLSYTSCPASAESFSLHSWIYPQSSLPPSIMSMLSSSTGGVEMDFLNKRQLAWEDSFRCLYYMLRKSGCNVFYVCTPQFVVMFTAFGGMGNSKRICNAYISQSTRGLRSLLKEHDISFSMPLCSAEMEQISREDLVELSEIEKHNLGQAKRMRSMPDTDNSSKSLLAFHGNDSVHGLYDFLLNYRSLLNILTGVDVPMLCAPIPFLNAAVSSPEVRCKEIRRADSFLSKGPVTKNGESIDSSRHGICYSIEIKDAYLPPWVICSICSAMGSDSLSFEASFMTEPTSMGLNAALEAVSEKSVSDDTSGDSQEDNNTFGISAAVVTPDLHSASLKGLKFSNGSYVASLTPV